MSTFFLLLALMQAGAAASTEPPPAPAERPNATIVAKGADLRLLEAVRTIAGNVERLRGDRFGRRPLAVRAPEVLRRAAAEIRAFNVLPRERLEARGRAWADVGLGGATAPQTLLLTVAADLAGIAFDPGGNRLLVDPERLEEEDFLPHADGDPDSTVLMMTGVRPDEPLVAHMLMHVRQMERDGADSLELTTDRLLARAAWREGEANLVAVRYLFQGMGVAEEILGLDPDLRDVLGGALLPATLDGLSGPEAQFVAFVYLEGFALAAERFVGGGWPALERAMATQRTTSQIMHPGRPAPGQPDLAPGDPGVAGLELVDTDSLGEQGVFVLVSTLTGKDNLALQAGDGWAGDRLYRWEAAGDRDGGAGVTLWLTAWSDAEQAAEFAYAMARALQARFPGSGIDPAGDGPKTLEAGGRRFHLEVQGDRVRLRVGPPGPAQERQDPKTD